MGYRYGIIQHVVWYSCDHFTKLSIWNYNNHTISSKSQNQTEHYFCVYEKWSSVSMHYIPGSSQQKVLNRNIVISRRKMNILSCISENTYNPEWLVMCFM